jgi:hypothetical protein
MKLLDHGNGVTRVYGARGRLTFFAPTTAHKKFLKCSEPRQVLPYGALCADK